MGASRAGAAGRRRRDAQRPDVSDRFIRWQLASSARRRRPPHVTHRRSSGRVEFTASNTETHEFWPDRKHTNSGQAARIRVDAHQQTRPARRLGGVLAQGRAAPLQVGERPDEPEDPRVGREVYPLARAQDLAVLFPGIVVGVVAAWAWLDAWMNPRPPQSCGCPGVPRPPARGGPVTLEPGIDRWDEASLCPVPAAMNRDRAHGKDPELDQAREAAGMNHRRRTRRIPSARCGSSRANNMHLAQSSAHGRFASDIVKL